MQKAAVIKSKNLILNSLNEKEYKEISTCLEEVDMPLGKMLYHPGEKLNYMFFPQTSVISNVTLLENGSGVESGIIGREGVSDAWVILGDDEAFSESTVQLSGYGLKMKTRDFKRFLNENINFRNVILSYIHAYVSQLSQNAACLCYHNIEKRLARWMLMFADRSESETMEMTQEFIAQMLGVHRPSVSKNANKLQKMGLINYNRGTIEIINRKGLEDLSCECYEIINRALIRYLDFKKI